MLPVALSDVIAVGEVPTADEIAILADAGFRSVILTQPEKEVGRLLNRAEVAACAAQRGLEFAFIAIESRRPPEPVVAAFADLISKLPRPIYACCYSGSRAAAAWALAASKSMSPEAVEGACVAAGYDMSFLKDELASRYAAATIGNEASIPTSDQSVSQNISAAKPIAPLPQLQPSLLPRAAGAGGFAVAG